ncbi:MAG: PA14 domain-containing protein [Gammaproteobacteria bacterium]
MYSPFAFSQFNYSVYDGDFNQLPNFSALSPIETGTSNVITLDVTGQTETFGMVFTNQLNVSTADTFEFQTTSDDGSRLFIDDTLVVDNDGLHGAETVNGQIFLNAGSYNLRVEFFEKNGGKFWMLNTVVQQTLFPPYPLMERSAYPRLPKWASGAP